MLSGKSALTPPVAVTIPAVSISATPILGSRHDPGWRRLSGIRLVTIFLGFAVLFSAFWYPMWTAMQEPDWFVYLHYWMRSWI